MPALEPVEAWRVVASPAAIDAAHWLGEDVAILRLAPDEALGLRATGIEIDDPDAIDEPETGMSAALLDVHAWYDLVDHLEWQAPAEPKVLAQGKIAGVPARIVTGDPAVMPTDAPALLVVQTAFADELTGRLGW